MPEHPDVGGGSHRLTRANIEQALRLGVNLRVGIVACSDTQRVEQARRELEAMGVGRIGVDHVRAFGRVASEREPRAATGLAPAGRWKLTGRQAFNERRYEWEDADAQHGSDGDPRDGHKGQSQQGTFVDPAKIKGKGTRDKDGENE